MAAGVVRDSRPDQRPHPLRLRDDRATLVEALLLIPINFVGELRPLPPRLSRCRALSDQRSNAR